MEIKAVKFRKEGFYTRLSSWAAKFNKAWGMNKLFLLGTMVCALGMMAYGQSEVSSHRSSPTPTPQRYDYSTLSWQTVLQTNWKLPSGMMC